MDNYGNYTYMAWEILANVSERLLLLSKSTSLRSKYETVCMSMSSDHVIKTHWKQKNNLLQRIICTKSKQTTENKLRIIIQYLHQYQYLVL